MVDENLVDLFQIIWSFIKYKQILPNYLYICSAQVKSFQATNIPIIASCNYS